MKALSPQLVSRLRAGALAVSFALAPAALNAEDIDLFVSASAASVTNNPNVLFIIDNSANWNANNQHWVGANGESPFKQGQSELRALKRVIEEATDKVNIGLMMFHAGDPKGTAVRYAVRTMTDENKKALAELIGDGSCTDGDGANGTPKCIFKNFSGDEQVNTAATDYSGAMFEAFKYFGGCTSPADVQSGKCKDDKGRTKFGTQRYSNAATLTDVRRYDKEAYTDDTRNEYVPPVGTANSCARNYVIFIGNGHPNQDALPSLLSGVEGNASKLAMPLFNTTSSTTNTNIGFACGSGNNESNRRSDCTNNKIPQSLRDSFPADTYACVGAQISDNVACPGGNNRKFAVQATKTLFNVTATGTSAVPADNVNRYADEWARYLFTTDVNEAEGVQNVATYTLDVFKDQQDQNQTALLFSMAKYGGGRYFQASSEEAILKALRDILIDIQAVNTVFASASLPINATNRSQNENQVFIGMFRPDPTASPRWYGNLKLYQIAQFGQEFKLADASTPPQEAVSAATGFVQPCAVSFWTKDTTDVDNSTAPPTDLSYWNFSDTSGSHIGSCTTSPNSLYSDYPDGPQVEKGSAAQVVRLGNDPTVSTPTFKENRVVLTCKNDGSAAACNLGDVPHDFDASNVTAAAVGAGDATDHARIINFIRGLDVDNDNQRLENTDVRPSVHGDVAHSRPLPVNYGGTSGFNVVLFYGANDGMFRAVDGNNGQELWSFVAPEHHVKLRRLLDNKPAISYPPTPAVDSEPKDYFFDGSAGLFQNADNSNIWVFPAMRRGGRMIYGFDVLNPAKPVLKWRVGCTSSKLEDTSSCINALGEPSSDFEQMGQTWSTPAVARVAGFSTDPNEPVIIVGGGYDTCEDQDAAPNTECTATGYTRRGNRVFVINANTGDLIRSFETEGSVPADITLVDRNFDGLADHAYAATTTGRIYRIDFVKTADANASLAPADWSISQVAFTNTKGESRKFLFSPATLPTTSQIYLSIASGDRERPLNVNYPFPTATNSGVLNRAYMVIDKFAADPIDLDGDKMADMTTSLECPSKDNPPPEAQGYSGWYINLNAGSTDPEKTAGEQAVTSSTIFAGLIFFSTNRPTVQTVSCGSNLGEARGYALNLLNASGAADTLATCGGARSGVFAGGGLPPSPVTGTVPVGGKPVTVMIGGVQRGGGVSAPIGAQRVTPSITQRRNRMYWYTDGDK